MKFPAKHSVEPLENRIAPARTIVIGVPNGLPEFNDVDYNDADPVQQAILLDTEVEAANGDVRISAKLGGGTPNLADTFYMRLSAGDLVELWSGGSNTEEFLRVTSGNVIAFFVDYNDNNEIDSNELTGLALGKNASLKVRTTVQGDIVANLNENGTPTTADDEIDLNGLVSEANTIKGLEVTGGRVAGAIIAAGNISNIEVRSTVGAILGGSAANGYVYDYFPGRSGGGGALAFTPTAGKAGASITNVRLDALGTEGGPINPLNAQFHALIEGGGGGVGAAGGAVTFARISLDNDGFTVRGGIGGGSGVGKVNAGAGGAVTRVYVGGVPDLTQEAIVIEGGLGGNSTDGKGGAGGSLKDIWIGYNFFGAKPFATDDLLKETARVAAGAGGSGKIGGAGGSVTLANIRVETKNGPGDVNEIEVIAGAGGNSTAAKGKGGAGGGLLNILASNQDLAAGALYSGILLQAGSGGSAPATSSGGAGGSVQNAVLQGWEITVLAGNGADGKVGGKGGDIKNIVASANEEIRAFALQFDAGFGGNAAAGAGGKGGDINGVLVDNSDLGHLLINSGTAANGGDAVGGKGGVGGAVLNVNISDEDESNGAIQTLLQPGTIRSGDGGDGSKGGGNGGLIKAFSLESKNMNALMISGAGGNVVGAGAVGKGGNGGMIDTAGILVQQLVDGVLAEAEVYTGAGGFGAGNNGAGGAGGDSRGVIISAAGTATLQAGNGGNGQANAVGIKGGASGKGGSLIVSLVTALGGEGKLIAGDAGAVGGKAGAGGSIAGLNSENRAGLFALNNITIEAGDGANGGAGGSLKFVGYSGAGGSQSTTNPIGHITVTAGNGSVLGKVAGAGGSIVDLGGTLPGQDPLNPDTLFETKIKAGDGGGEPNGAKGGAGGSIQDLSLLTGGYAGALLTIQAGDGGDASNAATGAKGGDVKQVTVGAVNTGVIFRSVAAGDGGDAAKKGGAGGSVDFVEAQNIDIGDRRDVPYGFTQMGGIFAGQAGDGLVEGVNGKVTNIVAKGIGAIVAGRGAAPEAVELVDKISVTGNNTLVADNNNNVFVGGGAFRLTITGTGYALETVAGADAVGGANPAPAVQEVQTLSLREVQANDMPVVFAFGANSTATLDGNATAGEIETALNGLASIQAAGGVTVSMNGDVITITFNTAGVVDGVVNASVESTSVLFPADASAAEVKAGLDALPAVQYMGANDANPHLGQVKVTKNIASGSYQVEFLDEGNLVPLEGIEVYNNVVTALTEGSIVNTLATEILPGATALTVDELLDGGRPLPVLEFVPGDEGTPEQQIFSFEEYRATAGSEVQFGFSIGFTFVEQTAGSVNPNVQEIQRIDLAALKTDPRATFTLSYGNATTLPLSPNATVPEIKAALERLAPIAQLGPLNNAVNVTYNAQGLLTVTFNSFGQKAELTGTVNSTTPILTADLPDADYQNAINAMASVKFTDLTNRINGTVSVVEQGTQFNVLFTEAGNQQLITLNSFANEVQEIDREALVADPDAEFQLSFSRTYGATEITRGAPTPVNVREVQRLELGPVIGSNNTSYVINYGNRTSAILQGTDNQAKIQATLNQMGIGSFTVALNASGRLDITFAATGDQPNLFSVTATSTTGFLDAEATAGDVQTALNALPTIKGPSGAESVTVADQLDGDFEVTFSAKGHREPIVAGVVAQEEQLIDVTSMLNVETGSFRLGFGGEYTGELATNASAAEVAAALNALSTIKAPNNTGSVTVTSTEPGIYNVQFDLKGERAEIDVRFETDEVQDVDFTPNKPVTLTAVKLATATEVPGSDVPEEQTLTLGVVLTTAAAEYTISFNPDPSDPNSAETTIILRGTPMSNPPTPEEIAAAETAIAAAVNALPSLVGNQVTVSLDPGTDTEAGTIKFTFQVPGDQPGLFTARATQSTAPLTVDSTPTEVQDALNALATVKASGHGSLNGTVIVTAGTSVNGSNFVLRYTSGGDQALIISTQESNLEVNTVRNGSVALGEKQSFHTPRKGAIQDSVYALANLIGFFHDHNEIDANVFHFRHNGVPVDATMQDFVPGDEPIDGLVFAKKMNQAGLTLTPEAYRVGDVFYDYRNLNGEPLP